jgi:pilus assembly protein CpaB
MRRQPEQEKTPDVTVVPVAASNIKRGTQITEDMIVGREWPKSMIPQGAVLLKADILGKIAMTPLVKDEPIFAGKVGNTSRFSGTVKEGMRAYTILTPNDASLVAGLIEPGDKVDVLFTDRSGDEELTGGGSTTPLLQNIEVLAMGQAVDPNESREKKVREMRSVTLLVPLELAAKLALAQEMGTLHLALRSEKDSSTAHVAAVTMLELLRSAYPALHADDAKPNEELRLKPTIAALESDAGSAKDVIIRTLRGVASSSMVMRTSSDRDSAVYVSGE